VASFLRFETQAPEVVRAALMRPLDVISQWVCFCILRIRIRAIRGRSRSAKDRRSQCSRWVCFCAFPMMPCHRGRSRSAQDAARRCLAVFSHFWIAHHATWIPCGAYGTLVRL